MDTTVDPLVGRMLDQRYAVHNRLAIGGMATVYEAVDARLDRLVALKVMHPQLAANPDFVSRFIHEAKSAARLSHPNVVAVFDQGTDGGAVFLVMEHVAGHTLRDLLRDRGRLDPLEAFDVLEPVLAALAAAHAAGIVHRDVKPENVLLADDGRVKVADFGLARAVSAPGGATHGMLIGTVAYLSPEQVERGIADARSDVYSAGIMLYELLVGQKPYDGAGPMQVAYRHVHETVPLPSSRVGGIAPQVDALVARATSRDPDGRPADAAALLADVVRVRRELTQPGAGAPSSGGRGVRTSFPGIPGRRRPAPRPLGPSAGDGAAAGGVDDRAVTVMVPFTGDEDPLVGSATSDPPVALRSRGRRGPRRGAVALVLVLMAALGLSAGAWWIGAGPGAYTETPSLLRLDRTKAEAQARTAGLAVEFTGVFDETVPKDQVISTKPGAGERIRKDGTIDAKISLGPERFAVPSVSNLTVDEARQTLIGANLRAGQTQQEYSASIPAGRVIRTDPPAGTRLQRDRAVALVVSRGEPPVPVPSVVGADPGPAEQTLLAAGFQIAREEAYSATVPAGKVARQSPARGKARKGTTVKIWVSKGPELVTVPDVNGKPQAEARSLLEAAGLKIGQVFDVPGGSDQVITQDPGAGRQVPKGTAVNLWTF